MYLMDVSKFNSKKKKNRKTVAARKTNVFDADEMGVPGGGGTGGGQMGGVALAPSTRSFYDACSDATATATATAAPSTAKGVRKCMRQFDRCGQWDRWVRQWYSGTAWETRMLCNGNV